MNSDLIFWLIVNTGSHQKHWLDQFILDNYQLKNIFVVSILKGLLCRFPLETVNFEALNLNDDWELNFEEQGIKIQMSPAGKIVFVGVYKPLNCSIGFFFEKLEQLLTTLFYVHPILS